MMWMAFFAAAEPIYCKIGLKGQTAYPALIVNTLGGFMKNIEKKRANLIEQDRLFQWENISIHSAAISGVGIF